MKYSWSPFSLISMYTFALVSLRPKKRSCVAFCVANFACVSGVERGACCLWPMLSFGGRHRSLCGAAMTIRDTSIHIYTTPQRSMAPSNRLSIRGLVGTPALTLGSQMGYRHPEMRGALAERLWMIMLAPPTIVSQRYKRTKQQEHHGLAADVGGYSGIE